MKYSLALILALAGTQAFAQIGPGRGEVSIKDATASGSACPVGSATVHVTNSRPEGPVDTAVVAVDEFKVSNGAGERSRKFCNVTLDIKFPAGWSYAIKRVNTKASAVIQEGVTAKVTTKAEFRLSDLPVVKELRQQQGPWAGSFLLQDEFDRPVWSPCGRVLPVNVTTEFKVSRRAEGAEASIFAGHQDSGEMEQTYEMRWKRCNP